MLLSWLCKVDNANPEVANNETNKIPNNSTLTVLVLAKTFSIIFCIGTPFDLNLECMLMFKSFYHSLHFVVWGVFLNFGSIHALFSGRFDHFPILFFLFFSFFLSLYLPLIQDENLHSIILYEQTLDPFSLVPTLFSYPISWKPFLFFWTYAPFYSLPISPAISLRLPSILFGLLSLITTREFLKNLQFSSLQIFAILSMVVTSISFMYSGYVIHPDMMINFFVILSLYLISRKDADLRISLLVGLLAFIGVFVKTIFAFLIPFLCFFYFLFYCRQKAFSLHSLVILIGAGLGFATHFLVLELGSPGLGIQAYYTDFFVAHLTHSFDPFSKIIATLGGIQTIFETQLIWFVLSIFGFASNYKKQPFFSFWYLLCIPLIISQMFAPWYFLPVIIPISFFALSFISRIKKDLTFHDFDKFEKVVFSLFFISSFILLCFQFYDTSIYRFGNQKVAGEFLANKENVLIIGDYAPGIVGHKMHTEIKSIGKPLDFGWFFNLNQSDFAALIPVIYSNYSALVPNTKTGSFTDLYFVNSNFRKDSNLTGNFTYVAFVNNENPFTNGRLVLNESNGNKRILVYEFRNKN